MARFRFKRSDGGFAELRTRPAAMGMLNDAAAHIAALAGDGFEVRPAEVTGGRIRGRASVFTATPRAMVVQARDHVLEKLV